MRGLAGMGPAKKGEKKLVVLVAVFLLYLLFISRQILTQSPESKKEVSYQCFNKTCCSIPSLTPWYKF
jgi:hypothetical protein